jgi:hypothetical protein
VSVIDILFTPGRPVHDRRLHVAPVKSMTLWYQQRPNAPRAAGTYSHSIVAGGLDEMS